MHHDDPEDREEILRLIQLELDGEISPEDEARLQQALAERPDLQGLYEEDKTLARLFAEDRAEFSTAPAGLADRINAALIEEAPPHRAPVFSIARFARPAAAAAAIMVLVVGAFWAGRTTTSAEVPAFEEQVVEKFRDTVSRENLDATQAQELLDRFLTDKEALESRNRADLGRIARELEDGLQSLVESNRSK